MGADYLYYETIEVYLVPNKIYQNKMVIDQPMIDNERPEELLEENTVTETMKNYSDNTEIIKKKVISTFKQYLTNGKFYTIQKIHTYTKRMKQDAFSEHSDEYIDDSNKHKLIDGDTSVEIVLECQKGYGKIPDSSIECIIIYKNNIWKKIPWNKYFKDDYDYIKNELKRKNIPIEFVSDIVYKTYCVERN
jgi:hypothetical protein